MPKHPTRVAIGLLLLVHLLAACFTDFAESIPSHVSPDTVHVSVNDSWDLRREDAELVAIWTDSTATHLEFGKIGGIDLVGNDQVVILDRMAAEARVITFDGDLVATVGRQGQGPGEISGALTLAVLVLPGGEVTMPDAQNARIVRYSVDGDYVGSIPWDIAASAVQEWRLSSFDTLAVRAVTTSQEFFIRRDLEGVHQDTLLVVPRLIQGPSDEEPRWPLMPDRWAWDERGGDLVVGKMGSPGITLVRNGQSVKTLVWEVGRRTPSREDVEHLLRIAADAQGQSGDIPAGLRARMAPPSELHAFADIRILPGGNVMVQRLREIADMDRRVLSTMGARGSGGRTWDVFSWKGEHLGLLDFSHNVQVFALRGHWILGVLEGPGAVPYGFIAKVPSWAL